MENRFCFNFLGVRGSIACPSKKFSKYGGNTSCVSVQIGSSHIILDAGTGLRSIGKRLHQEKIYHFIMLMTHTHWDHVCGFPFFSPAYDPRFAFSVYCGRNPQWGRQPIRQIMAGQMMDPLFPVPMKVMQAKIDWQDFRVGENLEVIKDVSIQTAPLNHPSGATAYRINYGGRSLCYVTDTEHCQGKSDENVLQLIDGADAVIYDTTYDQAEYENHIGWGHSTWEEGISLCKQAGVRQLFMFHHDCERDDDQMEIMESRARREWSGIVAAREGMSVRLL